ncbi:MAG: hypothetical protein ACOC0U_06460 [Desulfovibrionales bacterium]
MADCTALVLDTPSMIVTGDGQIDLKNESIALSLVPVPKKGLGVKGVGRINLSFSELTRPFRVGGTLSAPCLEVDPTQTIFILGKAVGGVALFGPFGALAVLVSGSGYDENPCQTALERVEELRRKEREEKTVGQSFLDRIRH